MKFVSVHDFRYVKNEFCMPFLVVAVEKMYNEEVKCLKIETFWVTNSKNLLCTPGKNNLKGERGRE